MQKKNFFIFLTIICTLVLFELISFFAFQLYKIYVVEKKTNYERKEYVEADDISQKKKYFAFYGWRGFYSDSNKFKVRETTINKNFNNNYIYFFGGSTTLGHGVRFDQSIPSHFSNLEHKLQPINMGEDSYVSGQSLNRLIEIINEINENDIVVFYDGVNDVVINCQKDSELNGHSQVAYINNLIKNENKIIYNLKKKIFSYFQKLYSFKLINFISKKKFNYDLVYQNMVNNYHCDNKKNSEMVANNIIRHWEVAEILVRERGAKFYGFLQPSPYTVNFSVKAPSREIWKKSYDDVYPLIRSKIKNHKNFFDISKTLQEDYFVDWCCHLNGDGNRFMAETIFSYIFKNTK